MMLSVWFAQNREVRRVFSHCGHPVHRLIRVAYGPYSLSGDLRQGQLQELPVHPRIADEAMQLATVGYDT
jgi:16S rRNA U516 pseudouridylate synthase RsuA-like enzyme